MLETGLTLPYGKGKKRLERLTNFAIYVENIQLGNSIKSSSRGWVYLLEGVQLDNGEFLSKNDFDRVENLINECRKKGLLAIDFVAVEEARGFSGVETPEDVSPIQYVRRFLDAATKCENWYTPDWWQKEKYYIQMVVEKIDLKSLFRKTCERYHIPIATSRGWSSMLQRAEYASRFLDAEERGLKPLLLYCGDHDPDGLRISDFLRSNLDDLKKIRWSYGKPGYDPRTLTIERFGLDYDFIMKHNITWINNLITSSGKNLASPSHKNFSMKYVQEYLKKYGARKVEANALIKIPKHAERLCKAAIEKHIGKGALKRFAETRKEIVDEIEMFRERTGLTEAIEQALKLIDEEEESE